MDFKPTPMKTLLLVLLLAGCAAPETHEETSPAPPLFMESPNDLAPLQSLVQDMASVAEACAQGSGAGIFERGQDHPFDALRSTLFICTEAHREQTQRIARDSMSNGNATALHANLTGDLKNRMQAVFEAYNETVPGTVVDLEFKGWIAQEFSWIQDAKTSAARAWSAYNGTGEGARNPWTGMDAFLNLHAASTNLALLQGMIERYAWDETPCESVDMDAHYAQARKYLDAAIENAAAQSEEGDEAYVSTPYGRLVRVLLPELEWFYVWNWTEAVLWKEMEAGWANATFLVPPTTIPAETATSMIGQYQAQSITLASDDMIVPLLDLATSQYWSMNPHKSRELVAIMALEWPYGDIVC